jgi:G:T-mismatch repair DNA endonuclease (very short patch repair protein)
LALWIRNGRRGGTKGSTTLPELLVELALSRRNADYRAQVDMGMARPDFVVILSRGVLVIRVQGDYWHSCEGAAAKDARQKDMLETTTIFGLPVLAVADIWESDIYQSEASVDAALEQVR